MPYFVRFLGDYGYFGDGCLALGYISLLRVPSFVTYWNVYFRIWNFMARWCETEYQNQERAFEVVEGRAIYIWAHTWQWVLATLRGRKELSLFYSSNAYSLSARFFEIKFSNLRFYLATLYSYLPFFISIMYKSSNYSILFTLVQLVFFFDLWPRDQVDDFW